MPILHPQIVEQQTRLFEEVQDAQARWFEAKNRVLELLSALQRAREEERDASEALAQARDELAHAMTDHTP